jgi:hypothetical protein
VVVLHTILHSNGFGINERRMVPAHMGNRCTEPPANQRGNTTPSAGCAGGQRLRRTRVPPELIPDPLPPIRCRLGISVAHLRRCAFLHE